MSTSFPAVHHSYFIKKDGFGKLVADASWLIVQDGKIMSMDIMIAVIPRRLCQRGSEIPTFRAHTRQKQCHPPFDRGPSLFPLCQGAIGDLL